MNTISRPPVVSGLPVDSAAHRHRTSGRMVRRPLFAKRFLYLAMLVVVASMNQASSSLAVIEAPYFFEDFNSGQPNPRLFGYENFTLSNGVIRSDGLISDHNDRRYIRTVNSDYNTRDFRYELTFTTTIQDEVGIQYIGIGRGNRRTDMSGFGYNEPWESLYFRIHTPNVSDGFIGIANSPVNDLVIIGDIPNPGIHRARIEKIGDAITFAIDRNYNGDFVADMAHTFPDINAVAPYLDNLNSRLFFGTAFPEDYFDNMLVTPIPEPAAWLLGMFAAGNLVLQRRRTRPASGI